MSEPKTVKVELEVYLNEEVLEQIGNEEVVRAKYDGDSLSLETPNGRIVVDTENSEVFRFPADS